MLNIQHITPQFSDERGEIARVMEIDPKIKSALFISSKSGSIRANHYHKHDIHYTYLLTGKFEYSEKGLDVDAQTEKQVVVPGDLVISEAQKVHAMKFVEDSTMIVFSTEPRDSKSYEEDTVKLKLI